MIFTKRLDSLESSVEIFSTLTLPYYSRQKSRLKVTLDNGADAGLLLPRGRVLRGGDLLQAEDGVVIEIRAAAETVSTVSTDKTRLLASACYHLGNRHVALQIGDSWCRYLADHVLDDMVRSMGLSVKNETAPFEPEDGAYSQHSHAGDNKQSHSYVYVDAHGSHSHSSSSSSSGDAHSSSSSSSSHSDSRSGRKDD